MDTQLREEVEQLRVGLDELKATVAELRERANLSEGIVIQLRKEMEVRDMDMDELREEVEQVLPLEEPPTAVAAAAAMAAAEALRQVVLLRELKANAGAMGWTRVPENTGSTARAPLGCGLSYASSVQLQLQLQLQDA